jgi:hypothetical protein
MPRHDTPSRFEAKLLCPATLRDASWAFVVLPAEASARLPRRGRTTVQGTLNGRAFTAMLEPDGRLSHWLCITCTGPVLWLVIPACAHCSPE